ncbi:MAG: hypothetical protein QOD75_1192 [Blastocatellia bacterium]|jgi:hypothetical protein|nr:hypothetical protein [Blastocatellia bacterium]
MSQRLFFLASFIIVLSISAAGQSQMPAPPDAVSADKSSPNSKSIFEGLPGEEMRAKRTLRLAEKEHLENLERARDVAKLSSEIKDAFAAANNLGPAEKKKLEKVEKLTRRVRSEAGGSDNEVTLDKYPVDLESALGRLADVSAEMRKEVEKTPRQVVSTSVIDRANQILEIVQYARRWAQ